MKSNKKISETKLKLISKNKIIAYKWPIFTKKEWDKYKSSRDNLFLKKEILVKPRRANFFKVKAGQFFRIAITSGSQVGDLNLFYLNLNRC